MTSKVRRVLMNPTRILFLVFGILLISSPLRAQIFEYWGVSSIRGNNAMGHVYKTDENGENLEIVHHFEGGEFGGRPAWGLTQHSDGRIYGMTSSDGVNGTGMIYSISPLDHSFLIHHHYEDAGGAGTLTEASNGKLYGFGYLGQGILYEIDPTTNEFQIIHNFSRTDGRVVYMDNKLHEVSENVLYGVTERGGSVNDDGLIFKYDINTSTYEVLYEFDRTVGYRPNSLRPYGDGTLYGMTSWTDGSIFDFDPSTNDVTKIFEYPSVNGLIGDVLLGTDGLFYGITATGGDEGHGSLFSVNTDTDQFTSLHSFLEFSGPHIPDAPLIQASNGKFYGNTRYISYANAGITIFEYDPISGTLRVTDTEADGFSYNPLTEIFYCFEDEEDINIGACDSYSFNGQELKASGDYDAVFQNHIGCDSTVNLSLTILNSTSGSETIQACSSYEWNGTTHTSTGTYESNSINSDGCDHTETLNLTILELPSTDLVIGLGILNAAEDPSYSYQWFNCADNQTVDGATTSSLSSEISGSYYVKIDNGVCEVVSDCTEIAFVLEVNPQEEIKVFPNPVTNVLNVQLGSTEMDAEINIMNLSGQLVHSSLHRNSGEISLVLNIPKGIYFLIIKTDAQLITHRIRKAY